MVEVKVDGGDAKGGLSVGVTDGAIMRGLAGQLKRFRIEGSMVLP